MIAGDVFYVIEEGTFTIFDNSGRELARVSKGSCFGELALLHQVHKHPASLALADDLLLCVFLSPCLSGRGRDSSELSILSINGLTFWEA